MRRAREQSEFENFSTLAALPADLESHRAVRVAQIFRGTKIEKFWPAVTVENKNRASLNLDTARSLLKSDLAKRLFEELVTEILPRVRWNRKGRQLVTFAACAVALREDELQNGTAVKAARLAPETDRSA